MTFLVKRLIIFLVALFFIVVISFVLLAFIFGKAANRKAMHVSDKSEARSLCMAALASAGDQAGTLPGKDWKTVLAPYLEKPFHSGFALNQALARATLDDLKTPAELVLFFESPPIVEIGSRANMLPKPRHSDGYVIGFLDGHVETVNDPDTLNWGIKNP